MGNDCRTSTRIKNELTQPSYSICSKLYCDAQQHHRFHLARQLFRLLDVSIYDISELIHRCALSALIYVWPAPALRAPLVHVKSRNGAILLSREHAALPVQV